MGELERIAIDPQPGDAISMRSGLVSYQVLGPLAAPEGDGWAFAAPLLMVARHALRQSDGWLEGEHKFRMPREAWHDLVTFGASQSWLDAATDTYNEWLRSRPTARERETPSARLVLLLGDGMDPVELEVKGPAWRAIQHRHEAQSVALVQTNGVGCQWALNPRSATQIQDPVAARRDQAARRTSYQDEREATAQRLAELIGPQLVRNEASVHATLAQIRHGDDDPEVALCALIDHLAWQNRTLIEASVRAMALAPMATGGLVRTPPPVWLTAGCVHVPDEVLERYGAETIRKLAGLGPDAPINPNDSCVDPRRGRRCAECGRPIAPPPPAGGDEAVAPDGTRSGLCGRCYHPKDPPC